MKINLSDFDRMKPEQILALMNGIALVKATEQLMSGVVDASADMSRDAVPATKH